MLQINDVLQYNKPEVNLHGVFDKKGTCKFNVEFEVVSLKTTSGLAWIGWKKTVQELVQ